MLTVTDLSKSYVARRRGRTETVGAVVGATFAVRPGQFFTIVGPSGCGKTTILRCIAGLERPDGGEIELAGRPLFSAEVDVPPNSRGVGMVVQSYALWPHMDVFANVAFPLTVMPRTRRPGRDEARARVERALAAVRLDGLADRRATELSSGQQQRVALARALVTEPPLLLLDEPLSNVDAKLREEMRSELQRLQRELGLTAVYVTHDQTEALAMSDVIAVMNAGVIEQLGPPRDVYERPASSFVAGFVGSANLLDGSVEHGARSCIRTAAGVITVHDHAFDGGEDVVVVIRPERIRMARPEDRDDGGACSAEWRGRVRERSFLGDSFDYVVHVAGTDMRVRTSVPELFSPGDEVLVRLPEDGCRIVPADR